MSERWSATRLANGQYAFEVKQAGYTVIQWVLCIALCWILIGIPFVLLGFYLRSRKYRFSAGPAGIEVGGQSYPLDRINEIEIRHPRGAVAQSGPAVGYAGVGVGGFMAAGAMAGVVNAGHALDNEAAKVVFSVEIQVGSRHVPLAKGLRETHARGLFADVLRAVEGKL